MIPGENLGDYGPFREISGENPGNSRGKSPGFLRKFPVIKSDFFWQQVKPGPRPPKLLINIYRVGTFVVYW